MAKYYMLECFEPDDWDESALFNASPQPPSGQSWIAGQRFTHPPSEPIEFSLDADYPDDLLEMDNTDALIVSKRLHTALQEVGVDNLDVYDAIIKHEGTGFISHNYVALNVIGVVTAANLEESDVVGGMPGNLIDVDFNSVVLYEDRAYDVLMFRLAENTNALIVHETVKKQLLSKGFNMLSFLPPERWMG